MCKTYKAPKSETDIKYCVFGPVNPKQNVKKEDLPDEDDELGWEELNLSVNFGQIPVKECPICMRKFQSEHAYQIHIQKHKPECVHCLIKLKSWKEYLKHLPYCRKRANVITVPRVHRVQPERRQKLKYTCQLCKRKYKKEEHLRNHQINRCEKRYMSNGWIVKI